MTYFYDMLTNMILYNEMCKVLLRVDLSYVGYMERKLHLEQPKSWKD